MKKNYLLLFLLFYVFCGSVVAQKEENIWLDGLHAGIDFNSGSAVSFRRPAKDIWRSSATICDSSGNMLFFTNGFRIFNKQYAIMQNGDSLNLGDYFYFGYNENPIPDGVVILPFPGNKNKFYIVHTDLKFVYLGSFFGDALLDYDLFYDVVDMRLDSGLGGIVSNRKEIKFFSDTLTNNGIQAVQYGNGRDWWLLCHEYGTNAYYTFHATDTGIALYGKQNIGMSYIDYNAYPVYSDIRFNQQGTQLIKTNSDSCLIELYDFDRCSGTLSNRRQAKVTDTLNSLWGLCFSPSGRFAYVSANNETELFQFDLQAKDIEASKVLVGIYDGTLNPFQTWFYKMDIGPDNKIYICNYDGNLSLHVINSPDSSGRACNLVQNQLELPNKTYWGGGMPNLPNYRLSPLIGSGCDTVITTTLPVNQTVYTHSIYSNPSTGKFQLSMTGVTSKVPVAIYNTMGELVLQTTLQPENGFIHGFFNLQNEPEGVYLLKAQTARGDFSQKILKQ